MSMEKPLPEKEQIITLLCTYANIDQPFQQVLEEHMKQLGYDGLTLEWHHHPISAEVDWTAVIDSRVNTASVILVLLSSDLFLSDYYYGKEVQRFCERHLAQEALVLPLLLHPVDWQGTLFAQMQVLLLSVLPATRWSPHGEDFLHLVQRIHAAILDFQKSVSQRIPHPSFPIWHIPFPRNDLFTGHEDTFTQLSTLFAFGQGLTRTPVYALYGPSGIGKTEIALEYAYRFRHHYLSVFWLRADTQEALVSAFVSIAECLDLPERSLRDKRLVIQAVKRWFTKMTRWLLILDHVPNFSLVKAFLPETWYGHLLVTTQAFIEEKPIFGIRVEPMTPQEGGMLLLRQRALDAHIPLENDASEEDRDLAEEIAREAKGIPLALNHAGAYLFAAVYSIKGYLSLYRSEYVRQRKLRGNDFVDYIHPVAITFANAFGDIEKWYPAGADMLRICAFLHPQAIPEELILRGASCLGPHIQPLAKEHAKLREDLTALCDYGLLKRNTAEQTLSIHRLVQGLLKEKVDTETHRDWATRAIQAMNKTFPKRGAITWVKCQRWLPHILLGAEHIEYLAIVVPEAVQFLHRAGNYVSECGLYTEAEALLRQALSLAEKTLGTQQTETMQITKNLADLPGKNAQMASGNQSHQ